MLTSVKHGEQFEQMVDQLLKELHQIPLPLTSFEARRASVLTTDSVDDVAVFDSMIPSLRSDKAGQR